MTELIKIEEKEGIKTCNARDLHTFLEVKTRFNDWISNRINKYSFVENIDYAVVTKKLVTEGKDYYISLDMAKQLSMVENNGKGQEARMYFITCEKQLKQELNRPAISIDYDLIGKIVGVAVLTAINETNKSQKKDIKKKRSVKIMPDNPKPTASAIDFMDEWYISNDNYGMFLRKSVYANYIKYSQHIGEDPKGLKNFYEAFRKNPNVKEKKSGEDYFVISEPNE